MQIDLLTHRFFSAVRICSGELSVKQRLIKAWIEHLDDINPAEMPHCQRQHFSMLRALMYERSPLPEETAPQASVRKMSVQQAAANTNLITEIYAELVRIQNSSIAENKKPDQRIGSSTVANLDDTPAQHLN